MNKAMASRAGARAGAPPARASAGRTSAHSALPRAAGHARPAPLLRGLEAVRRPRSVSARIAPDQVGYGRDGGAAEDVVEQVLGSQENLRDVNEPLWQAQRDLLLEIRKLREQMQARQLAAQGAVEVAAPEPAPAPPPPGAPMDDFPQMGGFAPPPAPAAAAPAPPVPAGAGAVTPAVMPELGANLDATGCWFKVWAPQTEKAWVVGYNDAGKEVEAVPLSQGEGGIWGVHIQGVSAGDRYNFRFEQGGQVVDRRDAYARQVDGSGSDVCFVVDPSYNWTPYTPLQPNDYIIYELHVGSFTGQNDGVELEGLVSTFKEAQTRLDHIQRLGYNCVQMMPVLQFSGLWGYNPTLLFAPHAPYGTAEDLRDFVDACHQRGMMVLFDAVIHHGAARDNSLWEYDGWSGPEGSGGIYFEGGGDTPWGREFAFWKADVRSMLTESCLMYLREYNGDGIRVDSAHALPKDTLKEVTGRIRAEYPDTYLVAELTPEDPALASEMNFSGMWMQTSYFEMMDFMNHGELVKAKRSIGLMEGLDTPGQAVKYFMGSHDQAGCRRDGGHDPDINGLHRHTVDYFGGRDSWHAKSKTRLLYALNVVSAGIPMIFMGAEFYHDGWWHTDETSRMDWSYSEDETGEEMTSLVRDFNRLRARSAALRMGRTEFTQEDPTNGVLVFTRRSKGQRLIIVANQGERQWSEKDYGLHVGPDAGEFRELINSQDIKYGGWAKSGNADGCAKNGEWLMINLPKLGLMVFEEEFEGMDIPI